MIVNIGRSGGLTIGALIEMSGAEPINITPEMYGAAITSFALDSREVKDGTMFIALRGERTDGHLYIEKANAALTLGEYLPEGCKCPMLISHDGTENALGRIAEAYRSGFKVRAAAVTGSVGKTTTKEMIFSVLSQKYKTHKTEGNFNSLTGLPMSLMTLDDSYEAAVWEMGMSARGEIERMSLTAHPNAAAITNIGISHIEMLGSRENIRDAKLEIRAGMNGGTLILNGDEPLLASIDGAVYVSLNDRNAEYYADNITTTGTDTAFDLHTKDETRRIILPIAGSHNVLDAMLAYAVGLSLGVSPEMAAKGLAEFKTTGRRQHTYVKNSVTVIEDCYNAAPDSMKAALEVLKSVCGRRIAVLGDMRELGELTEAMHREVGRYAVPRCDMLVTFGHDALLYAKEAEALGMKRENIASFEDITDVSDIAAYLGGIVTERDTLLFKASNSLHLERVIAAIGMEADENNDK